MAATSFSGDAGAVAGSIINVIVHVPNGEAGLLEVVRSYMQHDLRLVIAQQDGGALRSPRFSAVANLLLLGGRCRRQGDQE